MTAFDQFVAESVLPAPGRTLIVGSRVIDGKPDRRRYYDDAVGVDLEAGDGVDLVHDLEDPLPDVFGTFAHVECLSVLEHVRRPWLMARSIERALAPGGTLFVSVPFVWRVHNYPGDYWRMTPAALRVLFPNIAWSVLTLAHWKLAKGDRVPSETIDQYPYMARCETYGFGVRACAS